MIYAGMSEQGLRNRNEDCIFLPRNGEVSLVIVADGMGGHNAGAEASRLAVENAAKSVKHGGAGAQELLRRAAQDANAAVYARAREDRECRGMGTTLVMAMLFRSHYVAANIGDSRLYHLRKDGLKQISRDHSYVAEMVAAGYLTPEQAKVHPRRNIITRALGTKDMDEVDIFSNPWEPGDVLMLCSDGLHGVLEAQDMERILREETDLQEACAALVKAAAYGGSSDNISVVLVKNEEVS